MEPFDLWSLCTFRSENLELDVSPLTSGNPRPLRHTSHYATEHLPYRLNCAVAFHVATFTTATFLTIGLIH